MTNRTNGDTAGRPLLLSIKTTAQVLGLSVFQVKKLIDAAELPARSVNGRKYIAHRDVDQFAHGNPTPEDAA